jgi:hypothetical protein
MSTAPGWDVHPAADLFPLMTGAEFDALVADIAEHGQVDPVVTDREGRLIDGRNRVRACNMVGVEPLTKVYDGDDVTQFVVSHNLHRRHLTDSQRAMIAARLAQRKPGYRDETAHQSGDLPNIGEIPPSVSQAAALLGVKENTVTTAKHIIRNGTEGLQQLVADGLAPVTTGSRVAVELSPDEQNAYVEKVRAGADPVKAAPPDLKQQGYDRNRGTVERQPAPRPGANKRKHLPVLDAIVNAISGAVLALDGVEQLDVSVTAEEATRLAGDLSTQIQALRRIRQLVRERTT